MTSSKALKTIVEEQAIIKERNKWEDEKQQIEGKLEEALIINSKLFEKVKRLEI
jgi:hypothetical protein